MKAIKTWINKFIFFIKRYWIAEAFSIIGTYSFAWLAELMYNNILITSYSGSIGAFLGFYITIYINEQKQYNKNKITSGKWINKSILKDLLIEFGLSEVFDVFIIRPLCLVVAQLVLKDFLLSMVVGSIIANLFFFLISGFMYTQKEIISNKINFIKAPNDNYKQS